MMQKWSQKGPSPLGAGSPLEGSLLRREQTNRKTTNYCRKLEVLCKCRVHKESEQSTRRIPTRLGRLRPGADLSCLRQCTRSGPRKIVCIAKVRVHTVICSGFAGSGAKKNGISGRNNEKTLMFYHISVESVGTAPKMTPGDPKSEKIDPRVSKMEPKDPKSEPFGAKRSPKGSQREPKGSQREPKGSQKGAKGSQREPKGSQREPRREPKR